MIFLLLVSIFIGLFTFIQSSEVAYDAVIPLPETEATTTEYATALKFKPQLVVRSGCLPYPAVDGDGNINEGLSILPVYWTPKCNSPIYTPLGSQVYGRTAKYKEGWAIMYIWYFPKDRVRSLLYLGHRHGWENAIIWLDELSENATITAVTVSGALDMYTTYAPPDASLVSGTSVKLEYTSVIGVQHYLKATTSPGLFQDLVMWEDMPEAARSALETTDYNNFATKALSTVFSFSKMSNTVSIDVPMIDDNFLSNLQKAYPWN